MAVMILDRISHLVKSINDGWKAGTEASVQVPNGVFGRIGKIESGGVKIDAATLDVEWDIPFDDDVMANEGEIIIYNLSKTTIQALKQNNPITVEAGYKNDTGLIFDGIIRKVTTKREGVDKKTTIKVVDDVSREEKKITNVTFQKGTKASYILRNLINRVSLPCAVFSVKRDHTYKDEVKIDGDLFDNIKKYAEVCGISVYINKRKIYARHLKDGDNIEFTVNAKTGLINSPEEFEDEITAEDYTDKIKGCNFSMLLQHRITTAAIINLDSANLKGKFRVRSGRHIFNRDEAITEVEAIE